MPVHGLNHINIRTPDYAETVSFLESVLGMTVTAVPGHNAIDRAAWVHDAGGAPLFHLARADVAYAADEVLPEKAPRGSGAIHHLALSCSDYEGMKSRLAARDIRFRENSPENGVKQIFLQDPSGITFELNFQQP